VSLKSRIEEKLTAAFRPTSLRVTDESHLHAGHPGAKPGGTHFRVSIAAHAFAGKGRIERHRMVHAALADEFSDRLHALAVETAAPDEPLRG
jgi:BolA protein